MLKIEELTQAIGTWIENHYGETVGKVEKIKIDPERNIPEYLILCCNKLFGSGNRYFAIPAIPSLINISEQGRVTLKVDIEVLKTVMGFPAHKCPRFDPDISDTIFELYGYEESNLQE